MTARPIWIDLANSPHVFFFAPVVEELRRRGVDVVVTARRFAQTLPLCERLGLEAIAVGHHGGGQLANKGTAVVRRAVDLLAFGRRVRPCLAVSHNSYAHALAAQALHVPLVTAMDYEHQPANHIAFRCASLIVVPDSYPLDRLVAQGGRRKRQWRYHGLKENISLAGFTPHDTYLQAMGIADGRPIVVVRPPATMALYHRFENPLFSPLLRRLVADESLRVLVLPRTEEQGVVLAEMGFGSVIWRGGVLDGRELIAGADAVVSAGGSMNREAAVLGTPAYSIFAGKSAAIDRALASEGRLTLLTNEADVARFAIGAKLSTPPAVVDTALVGMLCDHLLQLTNF